jgi:hypothetical protein
MALRAGNLNFAKGELAEELIARVDVQSYQSGTKRARNVIVLKYGGLTKRPGMRFVAEALEGDNPVRLLPFQFSLTQAYALELGQAYMRPAALGGLVLETKYKVTAITKAVNAQITSAYHGYSVGEQVFFSGITGMTQINGRFGIVQSVVDANNFTVDIDTRGFSTFVDSRLLLHHLRLRLHRRRLPIRLSLGEAAGIATVTPAITVPASTFRERGPRLSGVLAL